MIKSFFYCALLSLTMFQSTEEIKAIQITSDVPALGEDGKIIFRQIDTVKIYYYNNLVMHDLNYEYSEYERIEGSEEDGLIKLEIRHFYFVYEKDSLHGYSFYNDIKKNSKWDLVDKVLSGNGFNGMNLYPIYENAITISSSIDAASGNLQEAYKSKSEKFPNDTIFCTYTSKMPDIPYSFDKRLDSLKGMKMIGLRTVSAEQHLPDLNITLSAREAIVRVERIPVDNKEEIMSYFHRFMKL